MQSRIWVIGDSHARAFSYNSNFLPFFIGEGREHSFINDECFTNLMSKVFNILKEIHSDDSIVLFLGEPDTRFYLGRGWKPWKKTHQKSWKFWKKKEKHTFYIWRRSKIKKSFERYCQLINAVNNSTNARLFLLNITPSDRKDQNKLVDYFNKLLSKFCAQKEDVEFIDINTSVYNPETKTVKKEYYGDPVHLNMKLQLLVENRLIEKGIIEKSLYNEQKTIDKKTIKKNYKFNKRFGCYTLQ